MATKQKAPVIEYQVAEPGPILHLPEAQPLAIVSDTSRVLDAITQAALNPDVDVEKMERMKALYLEMQAASAKAAFMSAMADFQQLKQTIATNRVGEGPGGSTFAYADWPQMEDAVRPWLARCGLTIHMTQDPPLVDGKRITGVMVWGWLSHRDGHEGERIPMFAMPNPAVEMKLSPMQAIQQGATYCKRQIACMLLGVAAREDRMDDDGNPPGDGPRADWQLDDKQRGTLFDLMAEWEPSAAEKEMLLAWLKVSDIENIHKEKFETVVRKLREKIAAKSA
jgi:hypothetical protein